MHTIKLGKAGHPISDFKAYVGEIELNPSIRGTVMSIDGRLSVYDEPWSACWIGGMTTSFHRQSYIVVVDQESNEPIFQGEICWNRGLTETVCGLQFAVWPVNLYHQ